VGTYLVYDPELGWLSFGGNLKTAGKTISVEPKDSLRQRFFVAPLALWMTLDSGRVERVSYDTESGQVEVRLEAADPFTSKALLHVEQTAKMTGVGAIAPLRNLNLERGAYVVPLEKTSVTLRLGAVPNAPAKESK
jgi:hypothetical protein